MTVSCIQRDILLCAEHLDQLEQDFGSQLSNLRDTVQAKTAVPTAQVYVSSIISIWGHSFCSLLHNVKMHNTVESCKYVPPFSAC